MDSNYDYHYSFSVDDEIVSRYNHNVVHKMFLFETETLFIIKKRDGETEIIGSETYDSVICGTYNDHPKRKEMLISDVHLHLSYRLSYYGMPEDPIDKFDCDAIDFATRVEADPEYASRLVIPIHVKFEVVTLQRQGETIEEARDRAVGPQVLAPIYLYPFSSQSKQGPFDYDRSIFLTETLRRVRVQHVVDMGLMIQVCGICSRLPNIGTRITRLPGCKHVFHSHCILRWLWENDTCPTCNSVAYHSSPLDEIL